MKDYINNRVGKQDTIDKIYKEIVEYFKHRALK